jgi:predicted transcriptional regulator
VKPHVPKRKTKTERLSVFKGREAKLNKAIFHILAHKSPLAIYDMHKEVKAQKGLRQTRYASVNKRVRFLEESGYIKKTGIKKTKAGFQASTYDPTIKVYLALMLDFIDLEELLQIEDSRAHTLLAIILDASASLQAYE